MAISDSNNVYAMTTLDGNRTIRLETHFSPIDLYFKVFRTHNESIDTHKIKIKITGMVKGFELNDMSITYRTKSKLR